MTATEAARSFSELLNRVANGEEIEVTRSGAAVAVISSTKSRLISANRFRELIATAPAPDADFARDIRTAREALLVITSPTEQPPLWVKIPSLGESWR
jgi:prevent-host-death family protein